MDLISCGKCGVVLDKNNLVFPYIEYEEGIRNENAVWINREYQSVIPCPVCKTKITKTGEFE